MLGNKLGELVRRHDKDIVFSLEENRKALEGFEQRHDKP